MTLIKSISGIRGTIGGKSGASFTPLDVVKYTSAFGEWVKKESQVHKVVIGRDARVSGELFSKLVAASLQSVGIHVIDVGLSTTPTVELAVVGEQAGGGIIITASHNPQQWNALKLLNQHGEFLSAQAGQEVLEIAESGSFVFVENKKLGSYQTNHTYLQKHIDAILALPLVNKKAIAKRNFRIAIDAVNSTGGIAVPMLLEQLGVQHITKYFCEPNGQFPRNPEPLGENLTHICSEIAKGNFDLGIVVDPDVDRLVFVCEDGSLFGEEYTLVAVADYVLSKEKVGGNTVSNLSSTRALQDITEKYGGKYEPAAVGEVNVVEKMKATQAVIGGEGNGGVIYPPLHYGRDALVGIALFLTHLANFGKPISHLRKKYPAYFMSKNKIELTPEVDIDKILQEIQKKYKKYPINTIDGVRIDMEKSWVHLRRSNTEPIIRIYSEAETSVIADNIAKKMIADIKEIMNQK